MSFQSEREIGDQNSYIPIAKPTRMQWNNLQDLMTVFKALQIAERDLAITTPYELYLTNSPVIVEDNTGEVARVDLGAFVTQTKGDPWVIITNVDLDIPTRYELRAPSGGLVHEVIALRHDQIGVRVAEELHHFYYELRGKIPKGTIDTNNDLTKYSKPGHEQDALYYRFRLLAQLNPDKWKRYYELCSTGLILSTYSK